MTEQYSASELQQIFSNVCHELQSPLLAILGNIDLLKATIKEAKESAAESHCDQLFKLLTETDEYIHSIMLSTNHQITVTGKILSISKLDAGKVILRQKLFSPHDTVNDIVSVFKASLNVNQKIIIQLPEEELWVEGDETQLKQIIINLLNNAIKFTPQGTIIISLTCKTDLEENLYLFFTIQDSGIGMTESEQSNLFQRYSQANKYITEKFGGSGLGLAICKRLVELMGGTISVSSEKGVGTSFSFSVRCHQLPSTSTKVQLKAAKKVPPKSPTRHVSTIANIVETPLKPSSKRIFSGGDCGVLINNLDWSKNSLGSIDSWSCSLTSSLRVCLVSLFPMSIWWGPDHILLYNDPYRTILGHKHPGAMGSRGLKVWEEDASVNGPILKSILAGGDSVLFEDMLFHVTRDASFIEECYFNIAYSAMFDDEGNINGVLNVATETTENVIHTRRMSLLAELSKASEFNSIELVCQLIGEVLSKYSNDTPYSMLYLLDDSQNLVLRSCTGLLRDSHVSPSIITPNQRDAMPWELPHVMDDQELAVIENLPLEWELPSGIWPEPSRKAVVVPLKLRTTSQKLFGTFICGISPRRCFDDGYYDFINLVKVQIGAALDTAYRAEQLADLDKAKTAFFTNISHEFRTPLALMLGPLADSLDEKSSSVLSPEHRDRQLLIQRNAQRLLKLVNNLLEFSRLEAGRVDASYAPTDLTKLTKEICNTFSSVMKEADIDFILEMRELDSNVYIDKDMWEKIIFNLLSNAFKFTLKGQITVTLESFEDKVRLIVCDTGVGIPEKEIPRVFERFHRVENSHGRSFEGSGIGLALIQEFVKLHKGTITVKSTVNKGTCFTVTIPYGYTHLPADKVMKIDDRLATEVNNTVLPSKASEMRTKIIEQPQRVLVNKEDSKAHLVEPVQLYVDESKQWQAPDVNFSNGSPRANTMRVLLVDDNIDMRSYIGNILKQFWEVELAVDGLQALESALRDPPDLILTDIMMPNIDGLELIKRLRNNDHTKGIPIILLSARAGDHAKVEGLDTGADDYLIKTSFSEKELLARVRNHLELGRLRRYLEREVASRTAELIQLNTALYEFIDMICHEVRNPLHGIVGNCELLKESLTNLLEDSNTPETVTTQGIDLKKFLSNIEECVHHQTTMLDEVILLTKIDAKKIEFVNIVCEPSQFLSGVMHNFKNKISSKGIKIVLNPVKEGSKIMTDPRCVNQILNGLLANVIENSAIGSEIAVSQSLMADNNQFKLQSNLVCTSVDIDEKTFSSLINTFSQINIGVGQNYTKSRFSLAISNKLVGLMGGDKISISKEGTGETGFTFTVICQKADDLMDLELISIPAVIPPYQPTHRALIVEDNHINQTLCKALLRKLGFESEIANNGQEAVDKFKPNYFDFILMDVAMPIMDGIQATIEIRRIEAELKVARSIVIVGLSAYSQEEKINKASEAGMTDYISKPATFNKIANIIRQWTKPNLLRKTKSELLLQNSIVPNSEAITISVPK